MGVHLIAQRMEQQHPLCLLEQWMTLQFLNDFRALIMQ